MGFPMRLLTLLSVNKILILYLGVWQGYFIYMFVSVSLCVPILKAILRSSECKGGCAALSMRLCSAAGRPEAVSHAENHISFSSASLVLRQGTMDFQIQSCSALLLVLSEKLQPGITLKQQTFQQTLTVLSLIPRLQLNSLSNLGFVENFHSVNVTHSSSCWDNGKDKATLGCQETSSPNTQRTEVIMEGNIQIFFLVLI